MAHGFVPIERDQTLLLPPDLREWLPPDHLVWFVLDSVDHLDLSAFYDRYRTGAQGRAAYDPKMLVAVLLYAYATGVRSSRDIERHLHEDIAFRVLAANRGVDHATICRFRRAHEIALGDLFVQIVGLCVRAGMVTTTIVAIDGTKVAANASMAANVSDDELRKLAAKVLEEAEAIDAEEDRLYGDRRGDEIPPHLVDRAARNEWLRQQLARRDPPHGGGTKKINATDPESRVMKTPHGLIQAFNAQLAVSDDHVIVAADVTNNAADVGQLEPMIEQATSNLEDAGADHIHTIVADAGYLSHDNATLPVDAELLIAPTSRARLDDAIAERPPAPLTVPDDPPPARHDDRRRLEVMEAYVAKKITASEAATALRVSVDMIYFWAYRLRRDGQVPSLRRTRAPRLSARELMLERVRDDDALARYRRRAELVEPVIGQLKEQRRLRRFLHRGIDACRCELRMIASAQNLRRIWVSAPLSAVPIPAI